MGADCDQNAKNGFGSGNGAMNHKDSVSSSFLAAACLSHSGVIVLL